MLKDTSQFNEDFIKSYQYPEKLYNLRNDLPFLPKRTKKVQKIVTNLPDKNEFFMHIRNLKHALKYVHRLIKFNQNV